MSISAELANRIAVMPKIELHVHLEGATSAETIFALAERNGVTLPARSLADWQRFYEFTDFNHFCEVYTAASRCVRTPEDFELLVECFLQHQCRQNIRYSEVFINASHHLKKLPADELLDALARGAESGECKFGSRARFIPDISREWPETQAGVLDFAIAGHARGLFIGLGLGGKEIGFPPELFTETYAEARRRGLRAVAHAGETGGPASVRGARESLGAERIGHGVRCLEDESLVQQLQASQIPLEVCPQSNYCLGVVRRGQPHPIRRIVDAGLYCTVNSDDPPMFSTDLIREYQLLAEQGFSWEELWQLNLNALEASFLPKIEKARYRKEWNAFLLATGEPKD